MISSKFETFVGLVGLTVVIAGCPGDDGNSDTANTTAPATTGMTTTGEETTTNDPTTGEPPATGDETSSGSSDGADSVTGDPVVCDPPCEAGEECVDGACFPIMCDPPCSDTEMCVEGACVPIPSNDADYGPCDACAPGETAVSITGVEGCFCSPMCDGMSCPDPTEGTATAQCVLGVDPMMPTNCALVCAGDGDCPSGASCQDAGGGSICTHPVPA